MNFSDISRLERGMNQPVGQETVISALGIGVLALVATAPAGRMLAKERVARAMPLETLFLQRKQCVTLMQTKSRPLAAANAHLQDFKRLMDTKCKDMNAADVEADPCSKDRHVTESALLEIARRVGRNTALLGEALNCGVQQARRRNARGGQA